LPTPSWPVAFPDRHHARRWICPARAPEVPLAFEAVNVRESQLSAITDLSARERWPHGQLGTVRICIAIGQRIPGRPHAASPFISRSRRGIIFKSECTFAHPQPSRSIARLRSDYGIVTLPFDRNGKLPDSSGPFSCRPKSGHSDVAGQSRLPRVSAKRTSTELSTGSVDKPTAPHQPSSAH